MNNYTVNITSEASTYKYDFLAEISIMDVCVYCISVLFGFPTHSYVLWLIVTGTESGVASELFNLNLSVCEIGICLSSLLLLIFFWTRLYLFIRLAWLLFGLTVTGRPLFQCVICVERYLAVVHPLTFLKSKPLRYRLICCAAAWILTLVSCLCCVLILFSLNMNAHIGFLMLQFLFFLCIQLFCLVAVLRALKQSGPGDRRGERVEENNIKRRAFYLILITTVTMSLIYVPFIISGFSFFVTENFILYLFSFGLLCFTMAGFVQPVLYLHRAGKLSRLFSP